MLFDKNNMVNRSNYEEYFILYMDNELSAVEKGMVESFVAQHPDLAEELDVLMSTKLMVEDVLFNGKEELFSPAMKLNAVDEDLLLYIDDELPAAERKAVEEKINTNEDYALQHSLLMQTKLNAGAIVSYPDKKDLYRHERKVLPFGFWMRIAAAVIVLLLGSLFYFRPSDKTLLVNNGGEIVKHTDGKKNTVRLQTTPIEQSIKETTPPKTDVASVKTTVEGKTQKQSKPRVVVQKNQQPDVASVVERPAINRQPEVIRFNANRLLKEPIITPAVAVNKTIARPLVTSNVDSSYNKQNSTTNNPEVDWAVETEKKTPARGFFRKVSRFIERKAGIGTANADNELLIGAVALKLK